MLKSYCKDFLQHELGINVNENIFTWIEIPVLDFSRAKHFYESLLGFPIHESRIGGIQHGFWGHTANQVGGAIVKGEGVPSQKGALVYFDGGNDLNDYLQKVEKLGEMDTELFKEWFQAFSQATGITLHIENIYGDNSHHIIESCFKGLARSLRQALEIDKRIKNTIPSTKGTL